MPFRLQILDGDEVVADSGWRESKIEKLPDPNDPTEGGSILVREDDVSVSISRYFPGPFG